MNKRVIVMIGILVIMGGVSSALFFFESSSKNSVADSSEEEISLADERQRALQTTELIRLNARAKINQENLTSDSLSVIASTSEIVYAIYTQQQQEKFSNYLLVTKLIFDGSAVEIENYQNVDSDYLDFELPAEVSALVASQLTATVEGNKSEILSQSEPFE